MDNGSVDNSVEIISKTYPEVNVLRNNENEGFCRGNNIGIRYALEHGADYVWLVNSDCVTEVNTLEKLIQTAESSPEIGLVSPLICYFEDKEKVQFSGSYIDMKDCAVQYPGDKQTPTMIFQTGPNVVLWGTALLIKKTVIEKIGLLDERLFAYWEDTEFSLRSLGNGFRNVVCAATRVYHKRQLTADGEETKKGAHFYYYVERNYILLLNHEFRGVLDKIRFYLIQLAVGSAHTLRCPREYVDVALMGVWHGLKGISGPFSDRPKMPGFLKILLVMAAQIHPIFITNILTFNLKAAYKGFFRWHKRRNCNCDK